MSELDEVKDRVARQHGFKDWQHVRDHDRKGLFESDVLERIYDNVTWTFVSERAKQSSRSALVR